MCSRAGVAQSPRHVEFQQRGRIGHLHIQVLVDDLDGLPRGHDLHAGISVDDGRDLLRILLVLHGRRTRVEFIDPRDGKRPGGELAVPMRFLTSQSVEGEVVLGHDDGPWTRQRGLALHSGECAARWETRADVHHGERTRFRSLASLECQPRTIPPERSAQSPLLLSFELHLDLELGQGFALGQDGGVEFVDALLVCEDDRANREKASLVPFADAVVPVVCHAMR